jgi:thioredoxin 1
MIVTVCKKIIMETFAELIKSEKPVLVDFYADWCGPCKGMEPIIKDVAKLVKEQFRVVKVDIDKQTQTARDYQITSVPTFMIFKEGKVIWRHSGMIDKSRLLGVLGDQVNINSADKSV